jgi:23S rRNA (cytosine1962-C5)-methyltransferase
LRRDGRVRRLEGLEQTGESIEGALDGPIPVIEHGVRFLADPLHGQKTGWYFDQRDNRRFIAGLASGRSVLDLYCHTGGFALAAAAAGARLVNAFDSSEPALALARTAAGLGSHETAVSFTAGEAFAVLAEQADSGLRYDLVIADPPSFVKSRKDLPQGLRAYRKLARLAARLVKKDGVLFLASCSHQVEEAAFLGEVAHGLRDAGRDARIIRRAGASADHPVHPALPESDYLKAVVLALD